MVQRSPWPTEQDPHRIGCELARDLDAAADITGSIDHAQLKFTANGEGIHRVEFEPREPLNVNVTCQAGFTAPIASSMR